MGWDQHVWLFTLYVFVFVRCRVGHLSFGGSFVLSNLLGLGAKKQGVTTWFIGPRTINMTYCIKRQEELPNLIKICIDHYSSLFSVLVCFQCVLDSPMWLDCSKNILQTNIKGVQDMSSIEKFVFLSILPLHYPDCLSIFKSLFRKWLQFWIQDKIFST
jgi:hypothetical protein